MGHRKGGRPDRAADSRSAVSPLRPTEPRSPGAGGPPAFSAPQNSHSVPGPPLYGPTERDVHRAVARDWSERETSERRKQANGKLGGYKAGRNFAPRRDVRLRCALRGKFFDGNVRILRVRSFSAARQETEES